jgi:hypothetical protein
MEFLIITPKDTFEYRSLLSQRANEFLATQSGIHFSMYQEVNIVKFSTIIEPACAQCGGSFGEHVSHSAFTR